MQAVHTTAPETAATVRATITAQQSAQSAYAGYQIIRRNGAVVVFEPNKIAVALMKAFLAVHGTQGAASASVRETVDGLTESVVRALLRSRPGGGTFHIEDVQDHVELGLMRGGHHEVARAYVLYRERRAQERARQATASAAGRGARAVRDRPRPARAAGPGRAARRWSSRPAPAWAPTSSAEPILAETRRNLYDGVPMDEVYKAAILAARTLIEKDPAYTRATARLLLHTIRREILGGEVPQAEMAERYAEYFPGYIKKGVQAELLDEKLLQFDLARLGAALKPERDLQFDYLGLQTLYDRYFLHIDERAHRAAAGLLHARGDGPGAERDRPRGARHRVLRRAVELRLHEQHADAVQQRHAPLAAVELLPDHGGRRPRRHLRGAEGERAAEQVRRRPGQRLDAACARWARYIKGTNGKSQGVVPFLKVVNDTAVAVNQGGKRKGAVCAYLETWHLDIEEFLELRKNTGDDRRRTHDMNTANWIPDLFMKRVVEGGDWTLFSPSTCPDLHDKFGRAFEEAYTAYEAKADRGEIKLFKRVPAKDLWRKMLSMLFETGHPWITFKDACNVRSPQQHVGVVHSSNLCTEITLNTSDTEIAVCNLGSVNLAQHLMDGQVDQAKLKKTVATAMRMLDNVIDINYYAVKKARDSNLRHRPVGLGLMGFQDALYQLRLPYASERGGGLRRPSRWKPSATTPTGPAPSWPPSVAATPATAAALWDRGILPQDSLDLLARGAWWLCRRRPLVDDGLGRAARAHRRARHAQQQLRGHRADRHHLQHHRRRRLDRALLRQPVGQVATCRASSRSSTSTWCAT